MRRQNSSLVADFISEKGIDNISRTFFAYVPLENMVCYAVAESYDSDTDINSAKLAVESVLVAFERKPSFRNIRKYIQYAHDQIQSNSVKNQLEVAITVVVSDYTRIKYASCGNIKFYLLSDNAFYLKSNTETYYQFAAQEYGLDKAPLAENKNLLQYLGKKTRPKPKVSKKIELLEESTMLFTTCKIWEQVEDVEILDAYEESKPDEFLGKIQELYLLSQFKNPAIRSYSLASVFAEKTFKEDTAAKKKRRRLIFAAIAIAVILAIIGTIILSSIRASDRRAMAEIERLDSEGIRYSNYANYPLAYEQYQKATELTAKLRKNLQYRQGKRTLTNKIAERWHLFDSIISGDNYVLDGEYRNAKEAYSGAQNAYFDVYRDADTHTGLLVSEILADKMAMIDKYIAASDLINTGEMAEADGQYLRALERYREAESFAKDIGDLDLRKDLMAQVFEVERKMGEQAEVNVVRNIRELMINAENNLNFPLALQYCDFIISIYNDLNINDSQSKDDKKRIEDRMKLDADAKSVLETARAAVAAKNYSDALISYQQVMEMYNKMEPGVGPEQNRILAIEMADLQELIKQQETPPQEPEPPPITQEPPPATQEPPPVDD
ncbi:MAG: hypothetical protein LBB91_04405 [Clostridiales bacterium]|jgi:serine/threonine protein phosphatase PrpC|nr:hypothetical protein [Clostridiales bacterium]